MSLRCCRYSPCAWSPCDAARVVQATVDAAGCFCVVFPPTAPNRGGPHCRHPVYAAERRPNPTISGATTPSPTRRATHSPAPTPLDTDVTVSGHATRPRHGGPRLSSRAHQGGGIKAGASLGDAPGGHNRTHLPPASTAHRTRTASKRTGNRPREGRRGRGVGARPARCDATDAGPGSSAGTQQRKYPTPRHRHPPSIPACAPVHRAVPTGGQGRAGAGTCARSIPRVKQSFPNRYQRDH